MLDKVIGVVAIAFLMGFMGILIGFVPIPDLVVIIGIVVAMAAFDFYRALFLKRNGG